MIKKDVIIHPIPVVELTQDMLKFMEENSGFVPLKSMTQKEIEKEFGKIK